MKDIINLQLGVFSISFFEEFFSSKLQDSRKFLFVKWVTPEANIICVKKGGKKIAAYNALKGVLSSERSATKFFNNWVNLKIWLLSQFKLSAKIIKRAKGVSWVHLLFSIIYVTCRARAILVRECSLFSQRKLWPPSLILMGERGVRNSEKHKEGG